MYQLSYIVSAGLPQYNVSVGLPQYNISAVGLPQYNVYVGLPHYIESAGLQCVQSCMSEVTTRPYRKQGSETFSGLKTAVLTCWRSQKGTLIISLQDYPQSNLSAI